VLLGQRRELRMRAKHDPVPPLRQSPANPDEWMNVAGRTDRGNYDVSHGSCAAQ
jgi:hypothetical protein